DSHEIYFRSDKTGDKTKQYVYNINVLKQILGDDLCTDLLFVHAFTGCDTTSRIFGIGKKSVFQKIIKGESVFRTCSKIFCSPDKDRDTVESAGCKAMVSLFNGNQNESLATLRYNSLCKKVSRAKTFVTPERLPPTASATRFHSLRTHYQVMVWMGISEDMVSNDWGFKVQGDKLIPIMMDKDHAPEVLLKMIHCNCSTGCNTLRCTCKKHGLDCTSACGPCQEGNCDNMTLGPILDEDDDEEQ
ncbi:Hypothetical predicted protein, partial [Paramuricea clavata]